MTGIPKKVIDKPTDKHRIVLAYGEATGHAHAIYEPKKAQLLQSSADVEETKTYLKVKQATSLKHEEHSTQNLPVGDAIVTIQKEYSMGEVRRVMD